MEAERCCSKGLDKYCIYYIDEDEEPRPRKKTKINENLNTVHEIIEEPSMADLGILYSRNVETD